MNTTTYRTQKPLGDCSVTVKMTADGSYIWELRSTKRFDTAAQAFYEAMLNVDNANKPPKEEEDWIPIYLIGRKKVSK